MASRLATPLRRTTRTPARRNEEAGRAEVLPGVTIHGQDVGKWLTRQRTPKVWQALTDGQRECLQTIGITPPTPEPETPAKPSTTPVGAFERGIAALTQYKTRTGSLTVPRGHTEQIVIDGQEHSVKLGVFLSNTKSRRGKLTTDQLAVLADLGLDWATN
ncbi:helicase associated domain-containing protein [Streptomyces tauricus]|uniref:helicase associated domain-containing protein n=1 Tax=Streptomyces tauricus TaxID=68274 RepID=UPI0033D91A24